MIKSRKHKGRVRCDQVDKWSALRDGIPPPFRRESAKLSDNDALSMARDLSELSRANRYRMASPHMIELKTPEREIPRDSKVIQIRENVNERLPSDHDDFENAACRHGGGGWKR